MRCCMLVVFLLVGLVSLSQSATLEECETYCVIYQQVCPTFAAVYYPIVEAHSTCIPQCLSFPDNATLATGGDSYQCRLYHTLLANATQQLAVHCPHASPSGGLGLGGVCGTAQQNYCDKVIAGCPGPDAQFPSYAACMAEVAFYPLNGPPNATFGDSLQCRTNLAVAPFGLAALAPEYCPAAGPYGADNTVGISCGGACDNYCDHYMMTCSTANAPGVFQYANAADCLNQCASWYKVEPLMYGVQGAANNTFNCRSYHVLLAGTPGIVPGTAVTWPVVHCPHASPSGGSVCVTPAPTSAPTSAPSSASVLLPSSFLAICLVAFVSLF